MNQLKEYRGLYKAKLDSKGRVSVPSHFRSVVNSEGSKSFQETISFFQLPENNQLFATSPENLRYAVDKLKGSELSDSFAFAHDIIPDDGGRILLPIEWRRASFSQETELIFIGVGRKFEVWGAKAFEDSDKSRFEQAVRGVYAALD